MFIIGDILITLANVIHIVLNLYQWVIFAACIVSWIRPAPSNDVVRSLLVIVSKLTDPVFYWVRQRLPRSFMMSGMDFTPMIVWLAVLAADTFLYRALMNIGIRLSTGVSEHVYQPFLRN